MLPKYIKVKNFTSYLDCTIDFNLFGNLFVIVGENGAGKSSIIDMITTALFFRARGTDNRGVGMDDLINHSAEFFEIEYVFTMNETEYKIIRRKGKTTHELEFYINGISQTEKINETQQKINNIIKLDYETFLDTVCIGQGQSNHFMEKKPNERKDVFVQILGLDEYEMLEKHAKDLRKQTKDDIEKIEDRINDLQEQANSKEQLEEQKTEGNKEIKRLKLEIKNLESELEKILTEKAQYEQIKKQTEHILNQRLNFKQKIENLIVSIKNDSTLKENIESNIANKSQISDLLRKEQKTIDDLQEDNTNLNVEKSSLETTNDILTTQAKELKLKYDKLSQYNQATCNFCGHEITNDYKKQHLNDLMTEGKKFINQINNNKTKITQLISEIQKISNQLNQSKILFNSLQTKYNKILQAETQLLSLISKINDNQNNLNEYKSEYNKNLELDVKPLENKTFNDNILKDQVNQLRRELTSWESKVAIAVNKLNEIGLAAEEVKRLKEQLGELETLYSDYDSLVIAYGKSGIQADIITNALPEIEEEINNILSLLTDNITIEFKTQKDLKGKKSKAKNAASLETLDIIVNDSEGSRKYETYSGGEKFRVDFACHVGLSKFLAKRAGAIIDFFIVDEGLGSQDQTAIQNFIMSVYKLTKTFKQVMVVSHIDAVKEGFNKKILVEKTPLYGSVIKIMD